MLNLLGKAVFHVICILVCALYNVHMCVLFTKQKCFDHDQQTSLLYVTKKWLSSCNEVHWISVNFSALQYTVFQWIALKLITMHCDFTSLYFKALHRCAGYRLGSTLKQDSAGCDRDFYLKKPGLEAVIHRSQAELVLICWPSPHDRRKHRLVRFRGNIELCIVLVWSELVGFL